MPLDHLDLTAFAELAALQTALDRLERHVDPDTWRKLRPILALEGPIIQSLETRLRNVLGDAQFTPGLPLVFSIDHTPPMQYQIGADRYRSARCARAAAAAHFAVANDLERIQLRLSIREMAELTIFDAWTAERHELIPPAPDQAPKL